MVWSYFFHLESGDLERLFGTKKIWISKIEKLESRRFNKHLFLKNLIEFRTRLREIFFEKMLLELDKSFNVIVKEFMFQKQPPEMFYKRAVHKNFAIFTGKQLCWSLFLIKLPGFSPAGLLKRDSSRIVFLCILQIF